MKSDVHPGYTEVNVICSCGNKFKTRSTIAKPELHIEVCAACHPYYTGKQKLMDTGGRVDKFKKRYAKAGAKTSKADKAEKAVAPTAKADKAEKPAARS